MVAAVVANRMWRLEIMGGSNLFAVRRSRVKSSPRYFCVFGIFVFWYFCICIFNILYLVFEEGFY